jgi:hypothetical protein
VVYDIVSTTLYIYIYTLTMIIMIIHNGNYHHDSEGIVHDEKSVGCSMFSDIMVYSANG